MNSPRGVEAFLRTAFILLLLTGLSSGCATRKEILGFQEDTRQIRSKLDSLELQQRRITASLVDLDASVREMKAKTEYGSSALEEKVQMLAASLDDILKRMDRSLAPLEEYLRRESATDTSQQGAVINTDYYDAAMHDLSMGNYDLAEVGFTQFIQNYPQSDLVDDARYGLAETFYARKRYDEAAEEYARLVDLDPPSPKTPAALLKLGLCYRAAGKTQAARNSWQELIDRFPNADESALAKQRLKEILDSH